MSEIVGASTSPKPKGLHGLNRDNFTFLEERTFSLRKPRLLEDRKANEQRSV
jgi:hypothetical protein